MAVSTEERINLGTLQQTDPFIKCIKANAKHVTLYTFKADSNEWVSSYRQYLLLYLLSY